MWPDTAQVLKFPSTMRTVRRCFSLIFWNLTVFYEKVERQLNRGVADAHGVGLPLVDVLTMDKIFFEFLLSNPVRVLMVKFNEFAYMPRAGFLSTLTFTIKFKELNGFYHTKVFAALP